MIFICTKVGCVRNELGSISTAFQDSCPRKGTLGGHFNSSCPYPKQSPLGSLPSPTIPAAVDPKDAGASPKTPPPPISAITVTPEMIETWKQNESLARSLLTQRIPDSTLIVVSAYSTVQEMWNAIVKDYTYKGAFLQAHLQRKFMASRCQDKGDVQLFLGELCLK